MPRGTEKLQSIRFTIRRGAGWGAGGALRVLICAAVLERGGAGGGRGENAGAAGSSQGDGPGGALPGGGGRVGLSDPLERALGFFAEAADEDPGNPNNWHGLAVVLRRAERFSEAAGAMQRAVAMAPSHAAYRRELGLLLRSTGDDPGGIEQLILSVNLGAVTPRPPLL
ncbi:hypothetical protein T484DRAFT_1783450 [Baffinella frigidus]|nr:hypothetical protein T484DRAFT_1783450 [Cryptophyta sp. CCMP2293]